MATFYRWHIGPGRDGSFGKYAQIEMTINLLVLIDGVRVREQTDRPHQAKENDMRAFACDTTIAEFLGTYVLCSIKLLP